MASLYFNRYKISWELVRHRMFTRGPFEADELDWLFDYYFDRFGSTVIQQFTITGYRRRRYSYKTDYTIVGAG